MTEAAGYAVKTKDGIDLRTVFETRRGAAVNYLFVKGLPITNDWSDERIMGTFEVMSLAASDLPEIVRVRIAEADDGQG